MARKISIDCERCKGCTLCMQHCPLRLLFINEKKINRDGYSVIDITDINKCTGCGLCATMCPDRALKVKEENK